MGRSKRKNRQSPIQIQSSNTTRISFNFEKRRGVWVRVWYAHQKSSIPKVKRGNNRSIGRFHEKETIYGLIEDNDVYGINRSLDRSTFPSFFISFIFFLSWRVLCFEKI